MQIAEGFGIFTFLAAAAASSSRPMILCCCKWGPEMKSGVWAFLLIDAFPFSCFLWRMMDPAHADRTVVVAFLTIQWSQPLLHREPAFWIENVGKKKKNPSLKRLSHSHGLLRVCNFSSCISFLSDKYKFAGFYLCPVIFWRPFSQIYLSFFCLILW